MQRCVATARARQYARVRTIIGPTSVRGLGSGRSVWPPTRCDVGNAVGSASPQDRSPSADAVPREPYLGSANMAQNLNLQRELCGLVSKRQILRLQSLDQIAVLMPFPAVRIGCRLPSIRQAIASHPPHFTPRTRTAVDPRCGPTRHSPIVNRMKRSTVRAV